MQSVTMNWKFYHQANKFSTAYRDFDVNDTYPPCIAARIADDTYSLARRKTLVAHNHSAIV